MKKIQVGTVPQTAEVEVIFINSSFAVRVARVQSILNAINKKIEKYGMDQTDIKRDEKTGEEQPVLEYNGRQVTISAQDAIEVRETVVSFIDELVSALEGE